MLQKLLPIFCGALITISISLSSWTMKEVVDLRSKMAVIEANQFTNADGLTVWKEIAALKQDVAIDSQKIASLPLHPHPWFVDQVKSMENRINLRLEKVEEKIDKIPR